MKKLFYFLLVTGLLTACGNGNSNEDEGAKTAPVTPGIDNVNGNIPDTTEAIRLNRPLPVDSATGTGADSIRR